jgi:hypothetical protein
MSYFNRRNHGGVDRALLSFDLVAGTSKTIRICDLLTTNKI